MPARLIMNLKTITIYTGNDLKDLKESFNINSTNLIPSITQNNCFSLVDSDHIIDICSFDINSTLEFYNEWDYDFNLFKFQCQEGNNLQQNSLFLKGNLNSRLDKIKEQIKAEVLQKREIKANNINKNRQIEEDRKLAVDLGHKEILSFNKELDIEKLIEDEEIQKEKEEESELEAKLLNEKKKNKCITDLIEKKEKETEYLFKKNSESDKIKLMNDMINNQLLLKRQILKKKIENLRKISKEKKKLKNQQIMNERLEVANKLSSAYKKGDINKCKSALQSLENWKLYCTISANENLVILKECIESNNSDYCCNQEYGELYPEEKIKCIEYFNTKTNNNYNGKWIWQYQSEINSNNDK